MRVCIVSVPLTARSGVYRSTYDLVASARSKGLDWHAVVAMRPSAAGGPPDNPDGVFETTIAEHGASLVPAIRRLLLSRPEVVTADVVAITMIGQSDIAMASLRSQLPGRWVSFVRGLPWPAAGEANAVRRLVQYLLVARAMRAADEVWATTEVLATAIRSVRRPTLVPAGVPRAERTSFGELGSDGDAIFAGRLDVDKRPIFFLDVVRALGIRAKIYGRGPLESTLRQSLPGAELGGWTDPEALWNGASVFLGTSLREAFGRSAVEAALRGVPVILSTDYGAADFLFTDEELASQFVLQSQPVGPWITAVEKLYGDPELRRRVSDHVRANALELSIDRSVDKICERLEALQNS